jgi:DNA (cytosine-5)-methyltransferase 1
MRMLDLFAGIGGFSLAGNRAGFETAAFVEWEKYPQKVLAKNFPGVPIYGDIKEFHYEKEKIGPVDIICGGFPCQPFSSAGKRKGAEDDRYLWPEMLRVIREVGARWVVGENVAGILSMDGGAVFEEICTSLENEGYTVEAFVLPAISLGAPHRRDRVWIVAQNAKCNGRSDKGNQEGAKDGVEWNAKSRNGVGVHNKSDTTDAEQPRLEGKEWMERAKEPAERHSGFTTNANQEGLQRGEQREALKQRKGPSRSASECNQNGWQQHWYEAAAWLCRVDDGLPTWVDRHRTNRLKALGNSIVPQVAFEIFKAINEVEDESTILS